MNLHKFVSLCFSKYTQVGAKKYVDSYFNSCAPEGLSEKESRCIGHFLTLFKAIKLYTQFIPWVITKQGIQAAINATNPSAHPSSNPLIELTNSVMNSLDGFKGSPGYTDFQKKLSAFLDHFIERPNDTKEPSLEERGLSNAVVPFLALLELIRPQKNELSIRETYYTLTSEIVALITDKHYQPLDHKNDGQNIANSDCLIEHLTMFKALQDCPLKDSCQRIIDGVLNTQAKLLQPHRIRDQFPVLKDQHYLKSVMHGKPNEVPEFLRSPLYPILKEKTAKQQGLDYLRNNMLIGPPFQASVNESEDFGPESAINLFQKYAKPKKLGPGVNIEFFSSILIWDILSKIDCPTPPQLNTIISFSFRSLSEKGCCFFDEKRFPNDSDVTGIFFIYLP